MQGVNVKTRKRNVAVPHDPAGFADSVLKIIETNCADKEGTTEKLKSAVKAIDASNLDFSRYGVELFEIFFAGNRMGVGAKLADDTKTKLEWNVRSTPDPCASMRYSKQRATCPGTCCTHRPHSLPLALTSIGMLAAAPTCKHKPKLRLVANTNTPSFCTSAT